MGNYAYDVTYLEDLEMDILQLVTYNTPADFNPSVMRDIQNWVSSSASEMSLIYGEKDPWTVAAVDHPGSESVIKIINPNTKHGTRLASDEQIVERLFTHYELNWLIV